MPKSRFFRVATEGATTDGRVIERQWLSDMAQTYAPATYAARVNMEHIRGVTAEPPFQALGDVLSLKTENVDLTIGGKIEKRLALYAEIDALDPLVAMNKAGQKLYTSIEVNPNFAGTGKAYMVGLAVTDSPASLGTEMLQFCASKGEASPLAHRKQDKANLFTAAAETVLEFDDTSISTDDDVGAVKKLLGVIQKALGLHNDQTEKAELPTVIIDPASVPGTDMATVAAGLEKLGLKAEFKAPGTPPNQGDSGKSAPSLTSLFADPAVIALATGFMGKFDKAIASLDATTKAQTATDRAVKDLTTRIESIPNGNFKQRDRATGAPQVELTDC